MRFAGRTTLSVAVATATLTLALGGAALASPMGMVDAQHVDTHVGTGSTEPSHATGGTMTGTTVTMGNTAPMGATAPAGTAGMMDTAGTMSGAPATAEHVETHMGTGSMEPGHMFSDVAAGDWYEHYAEQMADHGFMGGFTDGTFGGYQHITRGQFAGVMARMMGVEPAEGSSFSDTPGFWGAPAIEALAKHGIVAGYANGAFGPYDDVTRAQMAAIMDRAWEWMEQNGTGAGMSDAEMTQLREDMHLRLHDVAGTWAEDHIAHMFQLGVLQGDLSGMFHPDTTATRAQAGAMMWRWYEALQQ